MPVCEFWKAPFRRSGMLPRLFIPPSVLSLRRAIDTKRGRDIRQWCVRVCVCICVYMCVCVRCTERFTKDFTACDVGARSEESAEWIFRAKISRKWDKFEPSRLLADDQRKTNARERPAGVCLLRATLGVSRSERLETERNSGPASFPGPYGFPSGVPLIFFSRSRTIHIFHDWLSFSSRDHCPLARSQHSAADVSIILEKMSLVVVT